MSLKICYVELCDMGLASSLRQISAFSISVRSISPQVRVILSIFDHFVTCNLLNFVQKSRVEEFGGDFARSNWTGRALRTWFLTRGP